MRGGLTVCAIAIWNKLKGTLKRDVLQNLSVAKIDMNCSTERDREF